MPYKKIRFCSNLLENVEHLVMDETFDPIILGKSVTPLLWIYTKNKAGKIIPVIQRNISIAPAISIKIDEEKKNMRVILTAGGEEIVILEIDYSRDEILEIVNVNLIPIGYNITGTSEKLMVGKRGYKDNTFVNVNTFLAVG